MFKTRCWSNQFVQTKDAQWYIIFIAWFIYIWSQKEKSTWIVQHFPSTHFSSYLATILCPMFLISLLIDIYAPQRKAKQEEMGIWLTDGYTDGWIHDIERNEWWRIYWHDKWHSLFGNVTVFMHYCKVQNMTLQKYHMTINRLATAGPKDAKEPSILIDV